MSTETATATALVQDNVVDEKTAFVAKMLSSVRLEPQRQTDQSLITAGFTVGDEAKASQEDRFVAGLAALLYNIEPKSGRFDKAEVWALMARIDEMVNEQVNAVIHHPDFQALESNWRGLDDLVKNTNFKADIVIDVLDVTKDEIDEDFENNSASIFGTSLFQKMYSNEYDQYGGKPFGSVIGLYEFENTPRDLFWLRTMGKLANAAHAPFIAAVSPKFFGCQSVDEVEAIKDLEGLMNTPKYSAWNAFRDTEESAYIGLTFPRYVVRIPWHPETNPVPKLNFTEEAKGKRDNYLWGNCAMLMARNMHRAFADSGWCQYIRGPKGGGLITGLPVDMFDVRGQEEMMPPVELTIPDYRELEFARSGFIPLIQRKNTGDATFFSVQSVKRAKKFKDPRDSENAQLVCNLAYTFSITRIAHYVKSIMRDNIGSSTANEQTIQNMLHKWIFKYVTDLPNPSATDIQFFPFKAAKVEVKSRPGELGWYDCTMSVLPHIQFEGMSCELRLESRLNTPDKK
jgi:type VI secretion system protein ImpC